jgi:hypothetical protein
MNDKRVKSLVFMFLCLPLLLTGIIWRGSLAQTSNAQYFPETGHWVSGEFLDLYHSVDNPTELFGDPITVMFEDPITNRVVQYFERTRFELHPEEPAELHVQRTKLGFYLYEEGSPLPASIKLTRCQDFPETDYKYQVCDGFLDFFNKNGKVAVFGYPISNAEIHGDRIVQYFQLARLEWQPDQPPEKRVQVSTLGLYYFNKMGEDPRWRVPPTQGPDFQLISRIQARAFPGTAVVSGKGDQTVYVIVQDQNYRPVENARVQCKIILPTGEILENSVPVLTDEKGIATCSFSFMSPIKGESIITVSAHYSDFEAISHTSFRVWW